MGPGASMQNVHLSGTVTCPKCKGTAQLIEGTFNIRDGIIDVISASAWTRQKLAEYQNALNWAITHYAEQPEVAINRIEQVSPETAAFLQKGRPLLTRAEFIGLLSLLVALAAWLFPRVPPQSPPVQLPPPQINQFFNEAPDDGQNQHDHAAPPPPAPPPSTDQQPPDTPAPPPPPLGTRSPP